MQSVNPDGTFVSVSYDDWTTTTRDENGHQQKLYNDAYSRLIKKEEYFGADGRSPQYPLQAFNLYASTNYFYDSEGNLIQIKDTKNNITTMAYDKLGRKISMRDPDMGFWQYGYDAEGNLSFQIDSKNQRMDFQYDVLNRLLSKTSSVVI